jgi:hypothetical protein
VPVQVLAFTGVTTQRVSGIKMRFYQKLIHLKQRSLFRQVDDLFHRLLPGRVIIDGLIGQLVSLFVFFSRYVSDGDLPKSLEQGPGFSGQRL